jgi:hypothetical protein
LARVKRQIKPLQRRGKGEDERREHVRRGCGDVGGQRDVELAKDTEERGEDHPGDRSRGA